MDVSLIFTIVPRFLMIFKGHDFHRATMTKPMDKLQIPVRQDMDIDFPQIPFWFIVGQMVWTQGIIVKIEHFLTFVPKSHIFAQRWLHFVKNLFFWMLSFDNDFL